jgi:CheY-like chemotaxis protein
MQPICQANFPTTVNSGKLTILPVGEYKNQMLCTSILLADDDIEDQELLKESLLEQEPAAMIDVVWNGQEVVTYLSKCPEDSLPQLLILDFQMPILNAVEVLHRLQQDARYDAIHKVVWSTSTQPKHIKKCLENGAIRYFPKPNNTDELYTLASSILALCRTAG